MKKSNLTYRDMMMFEVDQAARDAYAEGVQDGIKRSVEFMFYMMAYTIEYKLELDDNKLKETMYYIMNNIDSFRTDHLDNFDFKEIKRYFNEKGIRMK